MHSDNPALVSVIGADIKGKVSLACYITAIPLALWQPWLDGALCTTVALIRLIPDRRLEQALGS